MLKNFFLINKYEVISILLFFLFTISYIYGPSKVNFFIILIILYSYFFFFQKNFFLFKLVIKNKLVITLFIFSFYIIFNSVFLNLSLENLIKSILYFRFILFSLALFFIIYTIKKYLNFIFFLIFLFNLFLSIDIIYQFLNYKDIFGFNPGMCQMQNSQLTSCQRFSGFFNQELIAGSFLSIFGIFSSLFIANQIKKKINKFFFLLFSILFFLIAILISGERNAFLNVALILFFNLFYNLYLRKYLILIFVIFIAFSPVFINKVDHLKHRYINYPIEMYKKNSSLEMKDQLANTQYGIHLINSFLVFKDSIFFGKGIRAFRNECHKNTLEIINEKYDLSINSKMNNGCSTHPHNLYFEILAEVGLLGLFIFLICLYLLFFNSFKIYKKNKNSILVISVLIALLFPLKPTGAIFSTIYASYIYFYLGLFLSFNQLGNINEK